MAAYCPPEWNLRISTWEKEAQAVGTKECVRKQFKTCIQNSWELGWMKCGYFSGTLGKGTWNHAIAWFRVQIRIDLRRKSFTFNRQAVRVDLSGLPQGVGWCRHLSLSGTSPGPHFSPSVLPVCMSFFFLSSHFQWFKGHLFIFCPFQKFIPLHDPNHFPLCFLSHFGWQMWGDHLTSDQMLYFQFSG